MKKYIFITALFIPMWAFAASGACSGHGGVSCSAGSDSDGSVICNDGWRNSSVSYSSMVMCQGYPVPAYTEPMPESKPEVITTVPAVVAPTVNNKPAVPVYSEPQKVVPPLRKTEITRPVEVPATYRQPAVETPSESVANEKTIQEHPTPKKRGFWGRLFGFILR